jgi:YcxB-like protein
MENPDYSFDLEYSKTLVKRAVFFFCRKTIGVTFLVVILLTFGVSLFQIHNGSTSWTFWGGIVVSLMGALFSLALFLGHYRNSMARFNKIGEKKAQMTLTDQNITFTSSAGNVSFPWAAIYDIWKADDFWLILFSKNNFMTLPLKNVPAEAQNLLLQKTSKASQP